MSDSTARYLRGANFDSARTGLGTENLVSDLLRLRAYCSADTHQWRRKSTRTVAHLAAEVERIGLSAATEQNAGLRNLPQHPSPKTQALRSWQH
jgi:hypothetical protein